MSPPPPKDCLPEPSGISVAPKGISPIPRLSLPPLQPRLDLQPSSYSAILRFSSVLCSWLDPPPISFDAVNSSFLGAILRLVTQGFDFSIFFDLSRLLFFSNVTPSPFEFLYANGCLGSGLSLPVHAEIRLSRPPLGFSFFLADFSVRDLWRRVIPPPRVGYSTFPP